MIITSTNDIKGYIITEYIGLVNANIVIGANIISDWFASWTDVLGGFSESYQGKLDEIYAKALSELKNRATSCGANALLGVHFDFDEISGKGKSMFMVTAIGTAVKITSSNAETKKNDRYEIYQKLYNLLQFKEKGIITNEQYEAEKNNLLLNHEDEIEKGIEYIKSDNTIKEAVKLAQQKVKEEEEERRKENDLKIEKLRREKEASMSPKERLSLLRKERESEIKNAIERFKSNITSIYSQVKDIINENEPCPQPILNNITDSEIENATYDGIYINPTDKLAFTMGRLIKKGKFAAAIKYYLDVVKDNDKEYAKYYVNSIYDIITLKNLKSFETKALSLVELKYLGQEEEAINEFAQYIACDRNTAKLVIDLL